MAKEIMDLTKNQNRAEARRLLESMNIVDIAEQLEEIDEQDVVIVFRMLTKDKAADVFAYLNHDVQQDIIEAITDREIGNIIDELFLDDAVDFIEEMPASVVKRVLANVTSDKRELINRFLKYPEDSAGSVMTIEYVDLKGDMTVAEAFAHIRQEGTDKETIYTCYVTDHDRRLIGIVSARRLLLAEQDALISGIMEPNVISANTSDDQESLTNSFRKYGYIAIPVVDNENRLVGIVTFDDAFTVQEEEATEDFELMAAMSPSEEPYLKASVWTLSKNRLPWLLLLMLSATVTGTIILRFEEALEVIPALVAFIPMLMDTGGNSGSQSSTMTIRGLALQEIELSDVWTVLWKEVRVAVICGAALFVVNFLRILISGQGALMALAVSLTLYITVIIAKSIGCLMPLGAKKLGLDPAVMASAVITTIVDALALITYFNLAKLILKI